MIIKRCLHLRVTTNTPYKGSSSTCQHTHAQTRAHSHTYVHEAHTCISSIHTSTVVSVAVTTGKASEASAVP